ncbi:MAG: BatA domain-containing protein [Planctomycetaceae bacterium]
MGIFLANPWGLLALAALPAVVAVHFLQERSRRVRASTLFLLERAAPTAAAGVRFERFRQSLPFWMQLLATAIAAWLLADPRFVRQDSRQTVAVVLDSSASMQACRDRTLAILAARLPAWNAAAGRTDWHLLETGARRPPLYAGPRLADLLAAARKSWQPTLGMHDVAPALGAAAALAPAGSGSVILVTDRPQRVPEGVGILSAGASFDNVGFSGGDVRDVEGRVVWRALVTNHGVQPQGRTVSLWRAGTENMDPFVLDGPREVRLEPGGSRTIEGPWPEGVDRLVLTLAADRFGFDDALPLVRPVPRQVTLSQRLGEPAGDLLARMALAAENVTRCDPAAEADVVVERYRTAPETDAIQVMIGADDGSADQAERKPAPLDPAWIATEDHPLVNDLAWGGLLSGPAGDLSCGSNDEPLLWKGSRPLVFLRHATLEGGREVEALVFNFDVAHSTATRTPAVVVLIGRFLDRLRSGGDRPWTGNVDAGQAIDAPQALGGRGGMLVELVDTNVEFVAIDQVVDFRGRAPDAPAFFAVLADAAVREPIVSGAAQFADARESDFRAAGPADTLDALRREAALKQSVEDPWAPLWLGALAAALAVSWGTGGRDAPRASRTPAP